MLNVSILRSPRERAGPLPRGWRRARAVAARPPRCTRVLHVVDNFGGGGAAVGVLNLICRTADQVQHGVVSLAADLGMKSQLPPGCDARALVPGPTRLFGFVARLARLVCRDGYDVLHVNNLGAWLDVALAARLTGRPCVQTFHGLEGPVEGLSRMMRWKAGLAARLTRKITAVGAASREMLCQAAGIASPLVEVLPNGIDVERFRPLPPDSELCLELRQRLRIGAETPLVAHVAGLRPVKDQQTLLVAWQRVLAQFEEVKPTLLVVGAGPCRAELEATVHRLRLSPHVRFLGARDDVELILPACQAFVLSSITEGLSYAILEAMACGLPVVATDVGGNRELVRPNETGLLVPVGDVAGLARALLTLLEATQRAACLGHNARAFVEARHDLRRVSSRYVEIYEEL